LVVQIVASLLQSSMQWWRRRWFSESWLSGAAKEAVVRISRAGIEKARALYPDGTAVLPFAMDFVATKLSNGGRS
jgi:hypothetical protein